MIEFVWFGTASVLLNVNGEKLLFDPFFRMNKKLEQPKMEEFCEVDHIFNTHPHFDHLCDLPQILQNSNAKFYGTPTAFLRLETKGVDVKNGNINILCPHECVQTKNSKIYTHRTKHVKNDFGIILQTAFRIIFKFQFSKAIKVLKTHNNFRMGGDIVAFEIQAEKKKILIFGSAGFDENAKLPTGVDVLVWPFQGRMDMTKYSLPIIEKINPKTVIFTHFDNAFPPITSRIKTDKITKLLKTRHTQMQVITPKYKQKIML